MGKTIHTKDKAVLVNLFDDGMIEIESSAYKEIGIEITKLDQTVHNTGPKGAIYKIDIYVPEENAKRSPLEYDCAWVMPDGKIVKRGEQF